MPFRYRMEKILEIRIKKKEEQIQAVIKAQAAVDQIEYMIIQNLELIKTTTQQMKTANPMMFEYYDNYIKHLWKEDEKLQIQKQEALVNLKKEQDLLIIRQQEVDVVEKHKENKRQQYLKEEKQQELKQMNEIGAQKAFIRKRDSQQENAN